MPFVPSTRKRRSSAGLLSSLGTSGGSCSGSLGLSDPKSGSPLPRSSGSGDAFATVSPLASDEEDVPLSISFLRRPSRSRSIDSSVDVERIMRQNTELNAHLSSGATGTAASTDTGSTASPSSFRGVLSDEEPVSPDSLYRIPAYDERFAPLHPLVRKKSGELVKSSLKLHSLGSSRSLPATPTYKQVHFGGDPDVRYFNQRDKPTFVSADNSPYSSEDEDGSCSSCSSSDSELDPQDTSLTSTDFYNMLGLLSQASRDYVQHPNARNLARFKRLVKPWQLDQSVFPKISYRDEIDREAPVFLESCHLNDDKTLLLGRVAVKNIDYSKRVTARYTFDDWTTAVIIDAIYCNATPRVLRRAKYDRFTFRMSVPAMFSQYLGSHKYSPSLGPCFSCCIRYLSGGQEYWDNNYGRNYKLNFVRDDRTYPASAAVQVKPADSRPLVPPATAKQLSDDSLSLSSPSTPMLATSPFAYSTINSPGTPSVLRDDSHEAAGIRDNFNSSDIVDPFAHFSLDMSNTEAIPTSTTTTRSPLMSPLMSSLPDSSVPRQTAIASSSAADNATSAEGLRDSHTAAESSSTSHVTTATTTKTLLGPASPEAGVGSNPSTPLHNTGPPQDGGSGVKPALDSKSYQDLLKKYCFFTSPSTVSSFLEDDKSDAPMMPDHTFY